MLALVHLAQGEADRARERTEAALELSSGAGLGEYWVNTAAHTARAGLLTRSGRAHEARAALDRALEVGRRGSGPVEMIHALVARGLVEAEGDRVAARAFVAEARSTLMSCADPGPVVSLLVRNAEDKLRIPRRSVGSLAPVIEAFSERELDVLRLLGERAVAARDRRRALHLVQHREVALEEPLPQARRGDPPRGGRPRARRSTCSDRSEPL